MASFTAVQFALTNIECLRDSSHQVCQSGSTGAYHWVAQRSLWGGDFYVRNGSCYIPNGFGGNSCACPAGYQVKFSFGMDTVDGSYYHYQCTFAAQ